MHGNASCNRLRGTWEIEGSLLTLKVQGVTRMAGTSELMDQERRLLEALEQVVRADTSSGSLVLTGADGRELIRAGQRMQ